ncbi:50S ribosomal protein L3 [Desulfoplanes sp.]
MKKTLGLIGKKLGMTRVFADDGTVVPATVIEVGPCPVIQKKVEEKDGYNAIQLGYESIASHRLNKPGRGHQLKADCGFYRYLNEFRADDVDSYEIGQNITADIFSPGERIDVRGTSKGKGFAGPMKRWNFGGAPATHGHEKVHRTTGGIGQCAYPGKVFKGKKMAGQMGNKNVTSVSLEVVDVRPEENLVIIRGQVPGPKKGLVLLRKRK